MHGPAEAADSESKDRITRLEQELAAARARVAELETEVREIEERSRGAQRLEAVGRLAGGMAHDFNNVLAGIAGHAHVLQLRLDERSAMQESVRTILDAVDRAAGLTKRLLSFSHRREGRRSLLDVRTVVQDVQKMLRPALGESIQWRLELPGQPAPVLMSAAELEQVIVNLVMNAGDAMPAGGKLTMRVLLEQAGAGRSTSAVPGEGYVVLEVEDTGSGMPQSIKQRVFEPFFTTKAKERGTGLGLSTVLGIVRAAGGTIEVASEEGVGSVFRVYVPRADGNETSRVVTTPTGELRVGTERIFLVEFDAAVRETTAAILEAGGYQVLAFADPTDALDAAPRVDLDLLLTDVVMPGVSGSELARRIRESRPQVPVLFMTARPDEVAADVTHLAAHAILAKPFTPAQLGAKLRMLLD